MMKLSGLFPLFLCIFMISCQKDDHPTVPVDPVIPAAKLKKVSLWLDGKDTLSTPDEVDTIYYNAKNLIEKVVSVQTGTSTKVATYNISYNTAGSISRIQSSGLTDGEEDDYYKGDFQFIYNATAKLDTLKVYWGLFMSNTFLTFKYDANGDLSDAYLYGHNISNQLYVDSHSAYFRNANGKLDSINIRTIPAEQLYYRSFKYNNINIFNTPDKTYLMISELRENPQFNLAYLNDGMLWLHQFMNPGDNLVTAGTETLFNFTAYPSSANFISPFYYFFNLYPDKNMRTIIPYSHNFGTTTTTPQRTMRFEYL